MSEHKRKALFHASDDDREGGYMGWSAIRWKGMFRYVALGLVTVLIALLFPRSSSLEYEFEIGSIWSGDTIRAPFAYPLYKDETSYERDVQRAVSEVLPIYVSSGMNLLRMHDTLLHTAEAIAMSETEPNFLSERSWLFVQSLPADETRLQRMRGVAEALFQGAEGPYRAGVINQNKSTLRVERIVVRRSEVYEDVVPINTLYDSLGVVHTLEVNLGKRLSPQEAAFAMELFYLLYKPMYVYSQRLTEEARENAKASVPRTQGIVSDGEVIVATGERITEATKLKLSSFLRSRELREEEDNMWLRLLGNLGHVIILMGLAVLFLYNFRRRIFLDNLQLGIILVALLLVCSMASLSFVLKSGWPVEYLILMPLLSMLLAILFDSRTAFYLTVIACFMVAGIRGNDYAVALACLSAGVLAAYTVRDIKSRTQLFRSIAYSMLGYSVAILALGMERGSDFIDIGSKLGFAAINATISPVLTFACILLIENLFGVATDLKLLEYDNLNHPLLRALADKAPGTYQHTLTIARLAESAANAVGANALLAKVGAYFHDIGKVAKAEYFVENQMQMANKHDRIKPEMSAKIIRNHVLDGIELAREYGLPQRIVDFIPMHHGTTVIKYFYDKARETNPDVSEADFRYPGPLPHTRETAIVMLADAVEATTRSLPNPTPKAIEETIDRAIKKRFSEGQLDLCELTLADLNKIKAAFIKNLIGMSHPRIQYKPDEGEKPIAAAEPAPKKKEEPVIPYIDDAFGNVDSEVGYGAFLQKKEKGEQKDDEGKGERK